MKTLEHELAELTAVFDAEQLVSLLVDDGYFSECTEHEGCRSI